MRMLREACKEDGLLGEGVLRSGGRKEGVYMRDIERLKKIYKEINDLTAEETLQLVRWSKTEEEQELFEGIGNYLLQKNQRTAIAENAF